MVVLVLVPLDIDCFMTSPDSDIKLRKVNDPEFNSLPRGVYLIVMDYTPVFVRRLSGHFVPLPPEEQELLRKKHIQ